jgi:DNA-binding MarR family transcriptional regulator
MGLDNEFSTEQLWDRPGFLIRRLNQIHHAIFFQKLQGRLSPLQYGLLTVLSDQNSYSQKQLGAEIGSDRTTLASAVDVLENRGLLLRQKDHLDQRQKKISITQQGLQMLSETQQLMHAAQQELLEALLPEEKTVLLSLMRKLVKNSNEVSRVAIKHFQFTQL